jgi:C4-dicarboxylate-specific signal transduction histidine kinase
VLQSLLDLNPFIQYIYVTDREGKKTIADRAKYDKAEIGEDLSDRDWFVNPIKDGKPYITDFYKSIYTGALCITVSAPICDESDEIIGVLGLDIRFEELAKLEEEKEF